MKTISEIESDHLLILEELNARILKGVKLLGGFTRATNKIKSAVGTLSYAIRSDNFYTKLNIIKRLEAAIK